MIFFGKSSGQPQPPEPFSDVCRRHLEQNVLLYRWLSEAEQEKLWELTCHFVARKFWEGCAGLEITDEIKVTIAGQACLLLLGFEDYCFDEVRTVLVYPGGFVLVGSDPLGSDAEW